MQKVKFYNLIYHTTYCNACWENILEEKWFKNWNKCRFSAFKISLEMYTATLENNSNSSLPTWQVIEFHFLHGSICFNKLLLKVFYLSSNQFLSPKNYILSPTVSLFHRLCTHMCVCLQNLFHKSLPTIPCAHNIIPIRLILCCIRQSTLLFSPGGSSDRIVIVLSAPRISPYSLPSPPSRGLPQALKSPLLV